MNQHNRITRFFAAVLAIGGIVGFANNAWMLYSGFGVVYFRPDGNGISEFLLICVAGLFVWAGVAGALAWQGTPYGRRWVLIFFASQIPFFNLPALKFWWSTGAAIGPFITLGADFRPTANLLFYWHLGAELFVRLFGRVTEQYFIGLNLFAVLAVILLVRAGRRFRQVRVEVEEVF